MKIWFGCTTAEFRQYHDNYFAIRNYLRDQGHVLPYNWLDRAWKAYNSAQPKRDIRKIYEEVLRAIEETDVSIIEFTVPNFSVSHQINYALYQKKPTLVMRLHRDNIRYSDSYLEAMGSKYLTIAQYTMDNYRSVIDDFIKFSRVDTLQRYNVVLSNEEKRYLDWASRHHGQSRSALLRKAIQEAAKADNQYPHVVK